MRYCSGKTYCCLWGKRIGRLIRIAALTPWHIVTSKHIAAFEANVSVEQYVLERLGHDVLFWYYILLPTGQTYRSTNMYYSAYAMRYCSGKTYCCLWGKCIGRLIRIAALSPWHIVMSKHIAAFEANGSVEQNVVQRLGHDILFWEYILLPGANVFFDLYVFHRLCHG